MYFIKEPHQGKPRYYFEDRPSHKCSPYFQSKARADQWRTQHQQTHYTGTELRHCQGDRRLNPKERARYEIAVSPATSVFGRRKTDQPLRVDRDLSKDHIDRLLE
ncbi:MAG: hypothetical protein HWE12_09445 [Oceanospirillaceae bacterium]|nr:hypothetical protein [Oceanospirillaceae bacterium]